MPIRTFHYNYVISYIIVVYYSKEFACQTFILFPGLKLSFQIANSADTDKPFYSLSGKRINRNLQLYFKQYRYSKTCVKQSITKRPKLVFKTNYRLMQVKSIAECSKGSILQL